MIKLWMGFKKLGQMNMFYHLPPGGMHEHVLSPLTCSLGFQ